MQTPVIIVIGPPKHGKTAARKILAELTFQRGESTSTVIYNFLAIRRKVPVRDLLALPKEEIRADLIEAGDFIVGKIDKVAAPAIDTEVDATVFRIPSALVRTLYMNGNNIIDGVRRKTELVDSKLHLEWNGVRVLTVWVERPGADTIRDNSELSAADADVTIINDGTLEDLKTKLHKEVLVRFFGEQDAPQPLEIIDVGPGKTIDVTPGENRL